MCAAQGGTALRARGCDAGACTGRSVSLTSSLTYTSSSLPVREGAPHATSDDARLHSRTPTTGDAGGATPAAGAPAGSAAARIQMSLPISVASAQSSSEARGADSIATRGAELLQQGAVEGAADVAAAARGQPRLDARWAAVPSPNQVPFCAIGACCRRVHARTGKQSLVANQRGGPVEKYSDFALPRLCLGLIRLIQTLWRQSCRPPRSDALVVLLVACLNADAMQHTAAPAFSGRCFVGRTGQGARVPSLQGRTGQRQRAGILQAGTPDSSPERCSCRAHWAALACAACRVSAGGFRVRGTSARGTCAPHAKATSRKSWCSSMWRAMPGRENKAILCRCAVVPEVVYVSCLPRKFRPWWSVCYNY